MSQLYTQSQAEYITRNYGHLRGTPLNAVCNITHIFIIPADRHFDNILEMYLHENATNEYICTTFGKDHNLHVMVLHITRGLSPVVIAEHIDQYLQQVDLSEILKH